MSAHHFACFDTLSFSFLIFSCLTDFCGKITEYFLGCGDKENQQLKLLERNEKSQQLKLLERNEENQQLKSWEREEEDFVPWKHEYVGMDSHENTKNSTMKTRKVSHQNSNETTMKTRINICKVFIDR